MTENDFTKINHDVNGNPRYVCHFLHLNTPSEKRDETRDAYGMPKIHEKYMIAVNLESHAWDAAENNFTPEL